MVQGPHKGRGAFLKNYVASRPRVEPKMAHHRNIIEEPEPTMSIAASLRTAGPTNASEYPTGPEFEFDDLPE